MAAVPRVFVGDAPAGRTVQPVPMRPPALGPVTSVNSARPCQGLISPSDQFSPFVVEQRSRGRTAETYAENLF